MPNTQGDLTEAFDNLPLREGTEQKLQVAEDKLRITLADKNIRENLLCLPDELHALCEIGEDKEKHIFVRRVAMKKAAEIILYVHQHHDVQNILNQLYKKDSLVSLDKVSQRLGNFKFEDKSFEDKSLDKDFLISRNAREALFFSLVRYDMKAGLGNTNVKASLCNGRCVDVEVSYKAGSDVESTCKTVCRMGIAPEDVSLWFKNDVLDLSIRGAVGDLKDLLKKTAKDDLLKPQSIDIKTMSLQ